MTNKNIVEKFIQNGVELEVPTPKVYVIDESMVTVSTDSTKWVSPYNTSYWYTNIVVNANAWIQWEEWAIYIFIINTAMVVASAYRNVRIKIWSSWNYIPLMASWNSILAWSSYFTKARMDIYVYKTTYQSWWALHMNNDTSYSAMSVAEWKTGTATSVRTIRADYLKQIIEYHAWNLDSALISGASYSDSWDWDTHAPTKNAVYDKINTMDTAINWKQNELTAWEWISIEDNVISATSTSAWNMNCITDFGRTRRFWTKAMFNALTEKDVNWIYVILSEKDYQKMIND